MDTKICIECCEEKSLVDFTFRKDRNKHIGACKSCVSDRSREYHKIRMKDKEYKENKRSSSIKSKYGITSVEYDKLMLATHCQICNNIFTEEVFNSNKVLDHDHTSLEVRGIICRYCNIMLGMARDNKETLNNAIKYLSKEV